MAMKERVKRNERLCKRVIDCLNLAQVSMEFKISRERVRQLCAKKGINVNKLKVKKYQKEFNKVLKKNKTLEINNGIWSLSKKNGVPDFFIKRELNNLKISPDKNRVSPLYRDSIKKRVISDYSSGKYGTKELSSKYHVDRKAIVQFLIKEQLAVKEGIGKHLKHIDGRKNKRNRR